MCLSAPQSSYVFLREWLKDAELIRKEQIRQFGMHSRNYVNDRRNFAGCIEASGT